jgi:hypothetical protein
MIAANPELRPAIIANKRLHAQWQEDLIEVGVQPDEYTLVSLEKYRLTPPPTYETLQTIDPEELRLKGEQYVAPYRTELSYDDEGNEVYSCPQNFPGIAFAEVKVNFVDELGQLIAVGSKIVEDVLGYQNKGLNYADYLSKPLEQVTIETPYGYSYVETTVKKYFGREKITETLHKQIPVNQLSNGITVQVRPDFTYLMVDEIQEDTNFLSLVQQLPATRKLALSATPNRNDYANWFLIAKTFFIGWDFPYHDNEWKWKGYFLDVDHPATEQLRRMMPRATAYEKRKWLVDAETGQSHNFEAMVPMIVIKTHRRHNEFYPVLKVPQFMAKGAIHFNNDIWYTPTSAMQREKLLELMSIARVNLNGIDDEGKIVTEIVSLHKGIHAMLQRSAEKGIDCLVIVSNKQLAKYIASEFNMALITGDVKRKERKELMKKNRIVATHQTVGVGISSLAHIVNLVVLEHISDGALLTQIRGRNLNNPYSTFTEVMTPGQKLSYARDKLQLNDLQLSEWLTKQLHCQCTVEFIAQAEKDKVAVPASVMRLVENAIK